MLWQCVSTYSQIFPYSVSATAPDSVRHYEVDYHMFERRSAGHTPPGQGSSPCHTPPHRRESPKSTTHRRDHPPKSEKITQGQRRHSDHDTSVKDRGKSIGIVAAVMGIVGGGVGSGWVNMQCASPNGDVPSGSHDAHESHTGGGVADSHGQSRQKVTTGEPGGGGGGRNDTV